MLPGICTNDTPVCPTSEQICNGLAGSSSVVLLSLPSLPLQIDREKVVGIEKRLRPWKQELVISGWEVLRLAELRQDSVRFTGLMSIIISYGALSQ